MSTKHVFCHKMPPLSSDDFAIELENSPDSCQLPAGALTIEPLSETTDILHLPCKVLTSALQGWLKSTHLIGTSGPPRGPVSFRSQAQTCRCPIRNLVRPAASSLFASATFLPPLALCFFPAATSHFFTWQISPDRRRATSGSFALVQVRKLPS